MISYITNGLPPGLSKSEPFMGLEDTTLYSAFTKPNPETGLSQGSMFKIDGLTPKEFSNQLPHFNFAYDCGIKFSPNQSFDKKSCFPITADQISEVTACLNKATSNSMSYFFQSPVKVTLLDTRDIPITEPYETPALEMNPNYEC